MLDLEKIKQIHRQKKDFKIETYTKILQMICKTVELNALNGETMCLYEVPEFILGETNYDLNECCLYLVKELKRHKFQDVSYYEPNVIYLTWKLD
jgi:hypothetical protein